MRSLVATVGRAGREPVPVSTGDLTRHRARKDQTTKKSVHFVRKVVTIKFQVAPGTEMEEYFHAPRKHNGPAEMPTKNQLRVATKIAQNKAKRLQAQVGSGGRLCLSATVSDESLNVNRTWVIDSGSCVNLIKKDELTKDEASRIRPVPAGPET